MKNEPRLLNPNGKLVADIEAALFLAKKTKSLWAKRLVASQKVNTIEGEVTANAGDYLCRGIAGELWPQRATKLQEKYESSGEFDSDGWELFNPKPNLAPVEAAQVATSFRVEAKWGELLGKTNDYVVRSTTDPTDIWIVDQAIFKVSYERQDNLNRQPEVDSGPLTVNNC